MKNLLGSIYTLLVILSSLRTEITPRTPASTSLLNPDLMYSIKKKRISKSHFKLISKSNLWSFSCLPSHKSTHVCFPGNWYLYSSNYSKSLTFSLVFLYTISKPSSNPAGLNFKICLGFDTISLSSLPPSWSKSSSSPAWIIITIF